MTTRISGGTIVTEEKMVRGDVFIRDGRLVSTLEGPADEVIDASGKGRITLPQLVKYACSNLARVAGLYLQKGAIRPGADADLVVPDPEREQMLTVTGMHGASDYTCYEGLRVKGVVEQVLLRGRTVALNGAFTGERGGGRYLRRGRSCLA